jgi:hypothetical protein
MSQNHINHIAYVIDASSSMGGLSDAVVKVVDSQTSHLARRSKELDQETRVSVYFFADRHNIRCVIFDKDVLRLPSIAGLYVPCGNTALRDGTLKAIDDLETTSQIYGDHAFLIYAITDGEENNSATKAAPFAKKLNALPDNWTVAALVPNASGVHEAKTAGFPGDNVMVWTTTAKGLEEAGEKMSASTETFFQNRAKGVRGSKSLFKIDTSKLSSKKVNDSLDSLKKHEYTEIDIRKDGSIKDIVEKETGVDYLKGSGFYQLTKPETIQAYKKVCIRNKNSGYVYTGPKARTLLSLPDHDARIRPEDLSKFDVFVQSTSVNRKLIAGTSLLVLKNP